MNKNLYYGTELKQNIKNMSILMLIHHNFLYIHYLPYSYKYTNKTSKLSNKRSNWVRIIFLNIDVCFSLRNQNLKNSATLYDLVVKMLLITMKYDRKCNQ